MLKREFMKKTLFIISTILVSSLALAQYGQIPNGGFENWTTTQLYDQLNQWGSSNDQEYFGTATTIQSTDAQNGSRSVELRSVELDNDTLIGYVYQGSIGQAGPDGGVPYTESFNTVKFHYKSSINPGDSAYLLVIRYMAGLPTGQDLIQLPSGTQNTWTEASITVSTGVQEELFLAFIIGDPFTEDFPNPGSWYRIDNVRLFDGATQRANLVDSSFENWTAVSSETPDNWFTLNNLLVGENLENTTKSTDANGGMYAARLETVVSAIGDTTRGYLSMGNFIQGNTQVPYAGSPTTFSGAYKYNANGGDPGEIYIVFYENNSFIGQVFLQFSTDVNTYTTFTEPIVLSGTPDSIQFIAASGSNPGEYLLLDELAFSGGNVGLNEFNNMSLSVFPNPATSSVMVKADGTYNLQLINNQGQIVLQQEGLTGAQEISLETIPAGNYFVQLSGTNGNAMHKLVVR